MMKIKVIIPITSISVNTIQHHRLAAARARRGSDSPPDCHSIPRRRYATSREGKKEINAFPLREATATVLVFSGYLSISTVLYHIFVLQSTLQRLLFSALPHYLIGKNRRFYKIRGVNIQRVGNVKENLKRK